MKLPTKKQQEQIVNVIHDRFYNHLDIYDVYKWLENFQDDEMDMAINVLSRLEYYREEDIVNNLQNSLTKLLPKDLSRVNLHILPLGDAGKSGDAMAYIMQKILKNNSFIKPKLIKFYRWAGEIDISALNNDDYVIFLDDIIGSGNSFDQNVEKFKNDSQKNIAKFLGNTIFHTSLLCVIIMDFGVRFLNRKYPTMRIFGEIRNKAFEKGKSPFGGYIRAKRVRDFCYSYGAKIYKGGPLGYKNSQALIVFAHAVPNNTLPIIWSDNYVKVDKRNWYPLIPRKYELKSNRSFKSRTDNNRWICRLQSAFDQGGVQLELKELFTTKNYNLIYLLRLLENRTPESIIINEMGITFDDLQKLRDEGIVAGFWNKDYQITEWCRNLYDDAKKKARYKTTVLQKAISEIVNDKEIMYIPETFKGLT